MPKWFSDDARSRRSGSVLVVVLLLVAGLGAWYMSSSLTASHHGQRKMIVSRLTEGVAKQRVIGIKYNMDLFKKYNKEQHEASLYKMFIKEIRGINQASSIAVLSAARARSSVGFPLRFSTFVTETSRIFDGWIREAMADGYGFRGLDDGRSLGGLFIFVRGEYCGAFVPHFYEQKESAALKTNLTTLVSTSFEDPDIDRAGRHGWQKILNFLDSMYGGVLPNTLW